MSSERLRRLTESMREADGRPVGVARDILLAGVGRGFDGYFAVRKRMDPRPRLHPLLKIVCEQVGEPTERWPVDNVVTFRQKYETLTAFMPSKTLSMPKFVSYDVGNGRVLSGYELDPKAGHSSSKIRLVFLHGGGFVLGDAKSSLPEADELCNRLNLLTTTLDYPLAPERPFPEAVIDVADFMRECIRKGERLILVGESAGANLALSSVLEDLEIRNSCLALVLVYPFLDLTLQSHSMDRLGQGHFLTKRMCEWFVSSYLGSEADVDRSNASASPVFSENLGDCPPMLVIAGEFDPLVDDARALVRRVDGAQLAIFPGMIHGFLEMRGLLGARADALGLIAGFLRNVV